MNRTFFSVVICAVLVVSLPLSASAAKKTKPTPKSDTTIQDLLRSEPQAANTSVDRRDALKPNLRPNSDPDSVRWQAGYVQIDKQWLPYEQSAVTGERAALLVDYEKQRDEFAKQPHGQWKLAEWCRKNGLTDQERFHLLKALDEHDPSINVDIVYPRLGCRRFGDTWVSPNEWKEACRQMAEIDQSHKRWDHKFTALAQQLDGDFKQRTQAEKQLSEVTDPAAIPVILESLCLTSPTLAEYGVKALGQIPEYQASRALAGQAVFSPWKPVRAKATDLLKSRKISDYAPDLLLLLSNPIKTKLNVSVKQTPAKTSTISVAPDLQMNWDYTWVEETPDTIRVGIRRLFPITMPANFINVVSEKNPAAAGTFDENTGLRLSAVAENTKLNIAKMELDLQAEMLNYASETMNDFRESINERVGKVLSDCTGEPMSAQSKSWWDWWTNYSAVAAPTQKNVVIVDERQNQPNVPSISSRTIQASCLVAGTPIWTETGLVAIDRIQPGDRVLSKDIESGELRYKAVIQTTIRPPTPVHKFTVAGETITASLGHHFWVSGDGWTKLRELIPEHPLHTVTGMQRITNVEDEGRSETVYNLVVADFHTYFVGKAMVLSHDVTPPSLTNVKVPGLAAE